MMMNRLIMLFACLYGLTLPGRSQQTISLAGTWHVRLDEYKTGEQQQWDTQLSGQPIRLPGTLDDAGIGKPTTLTADKLDKQVLMHLTRRHSYIGYAWYSRQIRIPRSFSGKNIELFLERILWTTKVWIDGREAGSRESLSTPHRYDLSTLLTPGRHLVVIRIDNSKQYNMSVLDMAHAYTDGTQIIWNGMLGRMEIIARSKIHLGSVAAYPSIPEKILTVKTILHNDDPTPRPGTLITRVFDAQQHLIASKEIRIDIPSGETTREIMLPVPTCKTWDEFHPYVYSLNVQLHSANHPGAGETAATIDQASTTFGMREISQHDGLLWINGRRLFLRGTLECDIFPRTGHPPMERKGWRKVFLTAKQYGLNHLRFHSWCPPEAAFEIADSLGMYLQIELPFWNKNAGMDTRLNTFLEEEATRISREYGSHPSFCLWSMGNELEGDFSWLAGMVKKLRETDPRHLYTSTTFSFQPGHGKWPEPGDDYYVTQYTKKGWVRGQGIFNTYPPSFNTDYTKAIDSLPIPIIIHEMGQYSVYPRLAEIDKYTGVLDPLNFKAIRKDLARKDMLQLSPAFTMASGKFAANLYKEEIERALKTRGMSGFDLLDLHDFPGQGTALVGILDAFWDSKGLVTAGQHRQYCSAVVPLIRYEKAVYENNETFKAGVEVANFSDHPLKGSVAEWTVKDATGRRITGGRLPAADIAIGNGQSLGSLGIDLRTISKASCLTIEVRLVGTPYLNHWRIWVYPHSLPVGSTASTLSTPATPVFDTTLDDALRDLRKGRNVLLNPDTAAINGVAGRFAPVFWSPVHFPDQPGTMGLLCDPRLPALAEFPTEAYSDWQWWDLVTSSKTMILDSLPRLNPIVRVIDNFFKNRRMADIIEASVSSGKLILVSMDLTHDLDRRPAARQLRYSLERYMQGPAFAPKVTLSPVELESVVAPKKETMLRTVKDHLQRAAAQLKHLVRRTPVDSFPETFDPRNNRWGMGRSSSWMSGFYPGELLYLAETTGDTTLRNEGLRKLIPLEKEQYNKDTHDLGFMMYCSFGNAEKLEQHADYTPIILNSARSLAGRFSPKVGCTRSWNSDSSRFMVIIDNMMNLELLFAGTRLSGDSSFYNMAVTHARTTMLNHFRPDYSSYHLVIYDPETGAVKKKQTVQGAADESAWSRGQAWGLYGYTMVYRETRNPQFLTQAIHIADYILPRLPADGIPWWDFDAPRPTGTPETATPRDVSAGAILCSALLELSRYTHGATQQKYRSAAEHILQSLMSPAYLAATGTNGGFLLKHGTGNYPHHSDIDVSLIYADYYYVEALLRYVQLAQEDTILNRYTRYLYHAAPHAEEHNALTLVPDSTGRWADIDYQDTQRANWQPLRHLERGRALALAWSNPASRRFHDPGLWTTINNTLDLWLKDRYHNSNWWHNEIGVPQCMRDIIVLLKDTLDPERMAGALQVLGQCRVQKNGQGANLVWSADLGLHLGVLTGNDTLIRKCARLLAGEVRITNGDGLQPDYSFHQHGPRLQEYQYGAAYLQGNVRLAWELQGTSWSYPEEKIKLLADFVLGSWQWMARGIHTVPGTIDRSVSRPDALNSADLRESLPYLCAIYPSAAREFRDIDQQQNDEGPALQGFRYFPCSDFTAYQQPRFSFFLKTISDRTLAAESINGENLKGRLMNSGDCYIIQTGKEYVNLMPVWDWNKLPGVTAFNGATRIDRHAFTGSVSDEQNEQSQQSQQPQQSQQTQQSLQSQQPQQSQQNEQREQNEQNEQNEKNGQPTRSGQSGLTVMDYALVGAPGQRLVARKFWACHKGWVVCLIGGMRDSGIQKAFTTLDQCRWQGAVTVGHDNAEILLHEGDHVLAAADWLWHGGVTTLFLQPVHLDIHAGTAAGSWTGINTSGSATPIAEKVFLPFIVHETNASTAYALTAGTTLQEARTLAGHPPCTVIRNDGQLQAIRFADGMLMAAFYSPGTLTFGSGHMISADHPCLVLVSGKDTFIADPSRQYSVITLHIDQTIRVAHLPNDGTTIAL